MEGLLRAAAGALRGLAGSSGASAARAAAQQQQRRGAHELHVKNNKFVEEWMKRREDMETEFQWDGRTTRAVLIGGILLPIAAYNMLVHLAHQGAHARAGSSRAREDGWCSGRAAGAWRAGTAQAR